MPDAADELFDFAFAADCEAANAEDAAAFVAALAAGFVFVAGEWLFLGGIAGVGGGGGGCKR